MSLISAAFSDSVADVAAGEPSDAITFSERLLRVLNLLGIPAQKIKPLRDRCPFSNPDPWNLHLWVEMVSNGGNTGCNHSNRSKLLPLKCLEAAAK